MRKMNIRGKKFIKQTADIICIISLTLIWIVFAIYVLAYEFKDTHSTTVFKNVIITISILAVITGLCDYISERCKKSIRREVKAKKAKTWWLQ